MYDPQTGEPNPYYEKLTGNKNPLLETPKMLNPNIREPKLKNRFLVYLPKELGIDVWYVNRINRPTIILKPKKFLGLTWYEKTYSEINIEIYDTIGSKNKTLLDYLENQKKFSFCVEELDPTGAVVFRFDLKECYITYLSFGDLDYKLNEINNIILSVTVGKLELK